MIVGDQRHDEEPVSLAEGLYLLTLQIDKNTLADPAFANSFGQPLQEFIAKHNFDNSPGGNDWRGRIRSTISQQKGIVQLSCLNKRSLESVRRNIESSDGFDDKLSFSSLIQCQQFAVGYYRFPIHPGDPNRYFDLAVAASYEEFQADVASAGFFIFLVSLLLIVGAAVLAFLFSRVLTQPLRKMTAAVERFSEDSIEIALPVNAGAEIGVLANAFRDMFGTVRTRTADLRQLNSELDDRVRRRTAQLEQKTEQLAEANRYKTDGLRGIAHELRAPLTGIDGAVRFLKSEIGGSLGDEKLKRVERIGRSCEHVRTIVDNLGQIARYERGSLELHQTEFAIHEFVEDTVGMLDESFQEKNLAVLVEVDPVLKSITADEGRSRQVLINLLSNAEKYTPRGGSIAVNAEQVEVCFNDQRQPEQHLKISVRDTGDGIPDDELPRVFEDFHRAKNTMQKAKGLGLGLAIARRFVEMHWGTIGIESRLGEGTTAWFTLPCQDIEREPVPPPSQSAADWSQA